MLVSVLWDFRIGINSTEENIKIGENSDKLSFLWMLGMWLAKNLIMNASNTECKSCVLLFYSTNFWVLYGSVLLIFVYVLVKFIALAVVMIIDVDIFIIGSYFSLWQVFFESYPVCNTKCHISYNFVCHFSFFEKLTDHRAILCVSFYLFILAFLESMFFRGLF